MADYNIFVYIFPSNQKWREKCGTFFLFLFRSKTFFPAKYISRKMSREISDLSAENSSVTNFVGQKYSSVKIFVTSRKFRF